MADGVQKLKDLEPPIRLIADGHTLASVTDGINDIVDRRPQPALWYLLFGIAALGMFILVNAIGWLVIRGTGIWGINIPVGWGFAIINFVWWIGIGHAGTLISAILLLLNQDWRTAINRFAEAMTIFAVMCAGLFPLLHTGRPWVVFFMMPYPSTLSMWPQFRSPLMWDVFAVSTYFTISLLFWYTGLIPDFATLRDRAKNKLPRCLYGIFSLGWRGSARHWNNYEIAYLLLAGLSTPLVVSVHSIVSLDFAVSLVPGWHTTIFPPYFVAGAVFAGFAMVLTLLIPFRRVYGLTDFVTAKHIDLMAKVMLATGLVVNYGYFSEYFYAYYSGSEYEGFMMTNRAQTGPKAWSYAALILCNGIAIFPLWFRKVRYNIMFVWIICMFVNVGMWLERYVIVVTSLHRDYLPSSWGNYSGTFWDWALFAGTLGMFLFFMMMFVRFMPMLATFEVRHLLHTIEEREARMEKKLAEGSPDA
jgi:molybdopterin-containing oxidoreductase family membrane subunit